MIDGDSDKWICDVIYCRQLIVQHYKVYYPVRHHLIQHIVNSVQKLGLTPNVSLSASTAFILVDFNILTVS